MAIHKVGIIGYGGFGRFLHHSWRKLESVEIVAVADRIASRNPGEVRFYGRWEDLIRDEGVDIVAIATPPSSHAEIACAAMEAGKHVFIEKPLATTIEDGKRVIAIRDRTGRKAIVDHMLRFNPIVERLGLLSREKVFGELRRVDVENYAQDSLLPPEHWFWDPKVAGSILIEHGVHFIDLVHALTDQRYQQVTGACHRRNERQEDQFMANVLYERGLMATHYHSFARPGFFEATSIRLAYDLAQIDVEGWIPLAGRLTALVNRETKARLQLLPGFRVQRAVGVEQVEDVSRPEGWGGDLHPLSRDRVWCGGIEYRVEEMVSGTFALGRSKAEVYADCLCAIMEDFIRAIEDPEHRPRVELEDGLRSLEIAVLATEFGRARGAHGRLRDGEQERRTN